MIPTARPVDVGAAPVSEPERRDHGGLVIVAVTALFAAVVSVGAVYHEPWRDEVVPMSLARYSSSVVELWRTLRWEGHPLLWYLVLRVAYLVFGTTAVMPVVSVLIAITAVVVFLRWAPFPFWLKVLFVFGYFPLYEYSVIARGNGLAMLLLFAFCALYARRGSHPVTVALALVALANTTVLGFVVAGVAGVAIAIDVIAVRDPPRPTAAHWLAVGIYVVGLVHALASNTPGTASFPTQLDGRDLGTVATAFVGALANPVAHSEYLYRIPFPWLWIWLLAAVLMRRRPALAAFLLANLVAFEMIFTLVYPASERHQGYVLLVVIATLWLSEFWQAGSAHRDAGIVDVAERWIRRALLVPLTVALGYQVVLATGYLVDEVQLEYSSSTRLAQLIGSDPRLERAIVIGEPESLQQSLPYYRDNPIYLPQENAFRAWMWSPSLSFSFGESSMRNIQIGRRADYNLAELLRTATELRRAHGVPVVMALGWWVEGPEIQHAYVGTWFEQVFTVTPEARSEFLARTELLGRLRDASFTDENYDVFVLW